MNRDLGLGEDQELHETKDGYIIYKSQDNWCEICWIEIDNTSKNNKAGTKLLQNFLNDMKDKGITLFELEAWVVQDGIYSIEVLERFYKKFGFKETDRMEEEGKMRVFFVLMLDNKSEVA